MRANPAGIRVCCCRPVEFGFQSGNECLDFGVTRTRPIRRRHLTAADLVEDLLPKFGVVGDFVEIRCVEAEATGHRSVVVTGDAVLIDECALRWGGWWRR